MATKIFRLADVVTGRHHADQAARSFEDAVGAGEAAVRQQRRQGAGDGEGVGHLTLVELEQSTGRGRRTNF